MADIRVALSHDVDRVRKTYQYITRSIRHLRRGKINSLIKEIASIQELDKLYWNFDDIMETEDKMGVKSTFFFLQESIPFEFYNPSNWKLALGRYDIRDNKLTQVIRTLDSQGWEIGLHGSYLSFDSFDLLQKEKKQLEDVLGHRISGIRQHYINLNDKTWKYQQLAGFKYDSTWGYPDRIGYRSERFAPFTPFNDHFVEFPLTVMDSCYMEDPDRDAHIDIVVKQTIEAEAVLVMNWHSNCWDSREFPGYKDEYVRIVRNLLEAGAVFKTLDEFYREYSDKSVEV